MVTMMNMSNKIVSQREVAERQEQDPDLGPVVQWMKSGGDRPDWPSVSVHSEITKIYWAQWDSLSMKDGVLYRKWESPDGSVDQTSVSCAETNEEWGPSLSSQSPYGGTFWCWENG